MKDTISVTVELNYSDIAMLDDIEWLLLGSDNDTFSQAVIMAIRGFHEIKQQEIEIAKISDLD